MPTERLDCPSGICPDGDMLTEEMFNEYGYQIVNQLLTTYAWPFLSDRAKDLCRARRAERLAKEADIERRDS